MPLFGATSCSGEPASRVHPAFTDKDIAFFAPLLALALSKATPEEVVTFYQTRAISAIAREVTSGGLFVQGDELHLILANYRSHTDYMADLGVAETQDDRLTPMQSLAPQGVRLDFDPHSAKRERPVGTFEKLFQRDHRELTVLYKQLPPRPLVQPAPSPVCLVLWSVWFIWLVSFNQTHETDQIDQIDRTAPDEQVQHLLETPLELESNQVAGLELVGCLDTRDLRAGTAAEAVERKGGRVVRGSLSP